MSDLLTVKDLEAAKKHDTFHSEVITGKKGGVAGGLQIDYATNAVTGQQQKTLPAVLRDIGYQQVGTFAAGYTLTNTMQTLLASTGRWYSWAGTFPHVVTAGTDPLSDTTNWIDRTEDQLRDDLNIVVKTFNVISEMIADTSLVVGQKVRWIGYYNIFDGGGNEGIVVAGGTGTDDGGSYFTCSSGVQVKAYFYDGVDARHFGCSDGDDCTNQLVNIATYINAQGGGKLKFKSGDTYYYTNHKNETDTSYYGCSPVFDLKNIDGLHIDGSGATLKILSGSKYGSFDPSTGASYTQSLPFWDKSYSNSPGTVWQFTDCKNVSGFLPFGDGNEGALTLGGSWGDTGKQIQGTYIRILNACSCISLYQPKSVSMPLDGIAIRVSTEEYSESCNINIYDGEFLKSGRNNLSLSGGSGVTFHNTKFNHAATGAISSAPKAGVDLEPESDYWVINPRFIGCEAINNTSSAIVLYDPNGYSRGLLVEDSVIWGSISAALFIQHGKDNKFARCKIHGKITYSTNTRFIDCDIDDKAHPDYGIFKSGLYIVDNGSSTVFDNTRISTTQYRGPNGGGFINNCVITCGWDGSESATGGTAMIITGFTEKLTVVDALTGTFDDTSRYYVNYASGTYGVNGLTISGSGNGLRASSRTGNYGEIAVSRFTGIAELSVKSDVAGTSTRILGARTSVPTSGAYMLGDIYFKTSPVAGGYIGWVCTTAGTPGTWKTFGTIAA